MPRAFTMWARFLSRSYILNKPGPLTDDEYFQVRMHAHVGAEIVGTIPQSDMMREAIEHHHQRFDGSGYPDGLRGEQIPLWARIIGLADAYANMVTEQSFSAGAHPRTGARRTREDERYPLRRHAGALTAARTEVRSEPLPARESDRLGILFTLTYFVIPSGEAARNLLSRS